MLGGKPEGGISRSITKPRNGFSVQGRPILKCKPAPKLFWTHKLLQKCEKCSHHTKSKQISAKNFMHEALTAPLSLSLRMVLIQGFPLCKFPPVMMKIISGSHKANTSSFLWTCIRNERFLTDSFRRLFGCVKSEFLLEIKYAPLFIMDIMDAP